MGIDSALIRYDSVAGGKRNSSGFDRESEKNSMNAEYHQNTMRWLSAIYGVLSTSLFLLVISGYASGLARRSVIIIIYFSLGMIAARFVYLAIDPGPDGLGL